MCQTQAPFMCSLIVLWLSRGATMHYQPDWHSGSWHMITSSVSIKDLWNGGRDSSELCILRKRVQIIRTVANACIKYANVLQWDTTDHTSEKRCKYRKWQQKFESWTGSLKVAGLFANKSWQPVKIRYKLLPLCPQRAPYYGCMFVQGCLDRLKCTRLNSQWVLIFIVF